MNGQLTPYGAYPSANQIEWHKIERYALFHFSMSTFTDKEWSYGDDDPDTFNPAEFDAEQWARACVDGGMKGLILVCKHHDGFCLWPTKTTDYSVKNSSWRNGEGDVVGDVAAACKKYGLKFGVYCSPWDRNNAEFGRPGYVEVFHEQFRELMTNYGELFEIWLDGANGGDGYYGGTHERRPIDGSTYYQWDRFVEMVRELQPRATIFGFDLRFVGNECGFADETCWHTYPCSTFAPGEKPPLGEGARDGIVWVPAECDFPLRHGWFYHENSDLKQPDKLIELYFKSIGRGCSMDIGIAPDTRGLVHESDCRVLKEFNRKITEIFENNLLVSNNATISSNSDSGYAPENVIDGKEDTFWASGEGDDVPSLTFEFPEAIKFNVVEISEYIQLGQRVDEFAVDIWKDDDWMEIATGTSVGYKRLLMTTSSTTEKIRIRFEKCAAPPAIAKVALFSTPASLVLNGKIVVTRDKDGNMDIRSSNSGLAIHYTLDGTEPTPDSPVFNKPFPFPDGGTVKAVGFVDDAKTSVVSATFGPDRSDWKVVRCSLDSPFENKGAAGVEKILDDNPDTYWHTYHMDKQKSVPPHEVVLDMGSEKKVEALTMMPALNGDFGDCNEAIPDKYEFHLSLDDEKWDMVASGEFANMSANPCMQVVKLKKPISARYLRFVANHATNDANYIKVAGIGAITK